MEFDKSIGDGFWNAENTTLLDDLAFSLLCDDIKYKNGEYRSQMYFRHWQDEFPFKQFYDKAKIILRNEKIKKVTEKTNIRRMEC